MSELARHICMAANLGMRDDAEQAIDSIVAERDALTREVEQLRVSLESRNAELRSATAKLDRVKAANDRYYAGQAALLAHCDHLDERARAGGFLLLHTADVRELLGATTEATDAQ